MIGVFDSGIGGLTVLRTIREKLPSADIVYFGDTKHAPYGLRSREDLSRLTMEGLSLLGTHGATSIVSACNSVSASLVISLFDMINLVPSHIIEMVGPTVSYLKDTDLPIVLAATPATVDSGIYQNGFRMIGKEVEVIMIPELAGAIEQDLPEEEIEHIIREAFSSSVYISGLLVLACTHYPLVLNVFQRVLGEKVLIFDPAVAVAERVERRFWPREAGKGTMRFIMSKDSAPLRALVAQLFPDANPVFEVIQ